MLPIEFSESLLRAVAELDLKAHKNISALLSGNYRSAFRGSGMQFKEFRHYVPGDDIRHMSWPVTARTGRATIKVYEEERELDVIMVVDVSGSSLFGMLRKRKIDMYAELVALLGLGAVKSGDNLGLMLFHERPQFYLPPGHGREQVMVALSHLLKQPLHGCQSSLTSALLRLAAILKHRSLVIVVSDFLFPPFEEAFFPLARRHEIVLLHCFDDAEKGLSLQGVYEVWDPESQRCLLLDGNSKRIRQKLSEFHLNLSSNLEELAKRSRSDYLSLSLEDDYLQRLVHFFRGRGPSRL